MLVLLQQGKQQLPNLQLLQIMFQLEQFQVMKQFVQVVIHLPLPLVQLQLEQDR